MTPASIHSSTMPQALGVEPVGVVVEVDRVDVLVLLRRVLGVGDRAVGLGGEPLRVRADPRVVGRACRAKSSATSRSSSRGRAHERVEVGDRAELRVDRVVPAVARADRPRRADVVRAGDQRVVGPLRLTSPIGWIGGRYTTSKPIAATRRGARPRSEVPCRAGGQARSGSDRSAPIERGKNSYQEPNSARGRSTQQRIARGGGDQVAHRVLGEGLGS